MLKKELEAKMNELEAAMMIQNQTISRYEALVAQIVENGGKSTASGGKSTGKAAPNRKNSGKSTDTGKKSASSSVTNQKSVGNGGKSATSQANTKKKSTWIPREEYLTEKYGDIEQRRHFTDVRNAVKAELWAEYRQTGKWMPTNEYREELNKRINERIAQETTNTSAQSNKD